jgi:hypothetical protein
MVANRLESTADQDSSIDHPRKGLAGADTAYVEWWASAVKATW